MEVLKGICEWLMIEFSELDVSQPIQAEPYDQTEDRETYRNVYRDRVLKVREDGAGLKHEAGVTLGISEGGLDPVGSP